MRLFMSRPWIDKEMPLKWNISNVWHGLTHPFRITFSWIVKSCQYARFLWNDYDFDYSSLLLLMQYKMKRMRKCIVENQTIVRADEIGAQIKHAEDLIEKWKNNDFCQDLYDAHEKKWGKVIHSDKPIIVDGVVKAYSWDISRENATTDELRDQERKETMAIHDKVSQAEEKCLDDLFSHVRFYVQSWWE